VPCWYASLSVWNLIIPPISPLTDDDEELVDRDELEEEEVDE